MAYSSYLDFIKELDKHGECIHIYDEVDTELEITAFADKEMKSADGGKALVFHKPLINGLVSKFPLVINSLGSWKRMAISFGREDIDELKDEIAKLVKTKPPKKIKDFADLIKSGISLTNARPKNVKSGASQEVVHLSTDKGFSLNDLPILKCWPNDGGRFITLPIVITKDPKTKDRNVGMYRMQVYDEWTTGMHWQAHKVAARHGKEYYDNNKEMPVAVVIGGDPALTFSATAPLPDGLDEILFAGYLRRKPVRMVKCKTIDLEVPADADFVLEGTVQPGEMRAEGPFGDHTGFYTEVDNYPVFRIKAITHRKDAIYPATIVGKPPMEDFYMGSASVKALLPVMQMNFPEIVDIALPAEGVFHNLVFVSIKKQYALQAYKIMNGLWGMGQMMFSKYIIVVDADCDVHNTSEVIFRWCSNTDPARDCSIVKSPCDALDHAQSVQFIGTHMGFDATKKLPEEGYTREWPDLVSMPLDIENKMQKLREKYNK